MANPGNTGQRYKLSRLVEVRVEGDKLLHVLSCGHNYYSSGWTDIEQGAAIARQSLENRQRCTKCAAMNKQEAH